MKPLNQQIQALQQENQQLKQELAQTKSIAANTDVTTSITAEDALLLMECIVIVDEKLDKIIDHLGL